jgi:hypothetical protein
MLSWAKFQLRMNGPRKEPGALFFPGAYSYVFKKYWDTLEQPLAHPGSLDEYLFKKSCMQEFGAALSGQDLSNFAPLVESEARSQAVSVAQQADISRLCPIQDAYDFWALLEEELKEQGRSSLGTVLGASAPG